MPVPKGSPTKPWPAWAALAGARHVFEAEMKENRRTNGRSGHERRPPHRRSSREGELSES